MRSFLLALILFFSLANAAQIYFNTSMSCGDLGCDFNSSSSWIGGILPDENDDVFILPAANETLRVYSNSSLAKLGTLTISNAVLDIIDGLFVIYNNFKLSGVQLNVRGVFYGSFNDNTSYVANGTSITVQSGGDYFDGSYLSLLDGSSSVSVAANGSFNLFGGLTNTGSIGFYATLDLAIGSRFSCEAASIMFGGVGGPIVFPFATSFQRLNINGTMEFRGGLNVQSMTVYSTGNATVYQNITVALLNLRANSQFNARSANGSIVIGDATAGSILLSSSNVAVLMSGTASNNSQIQSLQLGGLSNITLQNFRLNGELSFLEKGENMETNNVSLTTYDVSFNTTNAVAFPGGLIVGRGSYANFTSFFHFDDNCTFSQGTVVNSQSVTCASILVFGNWFLWGDWQNPDVVTVSADYVNIANPATLTPMAQRVSILAGSVVNSGMIAGGAHRSISIFGSYLQTGSLEFYGLTANQSSPRIWFLSDVSINGSIYFSFSDTPSVGDEYLLGQIAGNSSYTGARLNQLGSEYNVNMELELRSTEHAQLLILNITAPSGKKPLDWWVWVLIAGAIILVIASLMAFFVKRRRGYVYQPILGNGNRS